MSSADADDTDATGATGAERLVTLAEAVRSAHARLAALEADREHLDARKRQLWSRIAEIRAQSVAAGSIRGPLTRSDRQMHELVDRRAHRLDEIRQLLESRERRAAARAIDLETVQQNAEKTRAQAKRAREALQTRRAADQRYQALAAGAQEASQALGALRQRLVEARRERDEKTVQYERDALFIYLYERGYKTARYRAWRVTRGIDRWIAALMGFDQARQDYELLQEMPRWLEENLQCQARHADAAARALAGYIDNEPAAREAETLEHRAQAADNTLRDRRIAARATAEADARLEEQIEAFEQRRDPDSLAALELYRQAFHGQPTAVMRQLAAQTASAEDDEAVRELAPLDDRSARVDARIAQITEILEDQAAELERLRALE